MQEVPSGMLVYATLLKKQLMLVAMVTGMVSETGRRKVCSGLRMTGLITSITNYYNYSGNILRKLKC